MADEQIANGGHEVKIFSSGVAASGGLSLSPVIVSSGSRPLQISSSPGSGSILDGVAETKSPSTSITVFPAAASSTPVQSSVVPSGGSIVIRAATSTIAQQQAPPTSPSTATGTPIAVSSGITIRSSASAPSSSLTITNNERPTNDVTAASSSVLVPEVNPATPESRSIVITQSSAIVANPLPDSGSLHQKVEGSSRTAVISTVSAPITQSPTTSPAVTSSPPEIRAQAAEIIDQPPEPQQSNGVRQSSPEISSVASPSPSVIRVPSSASSRSRPASTVYENPRQPPMTWSDLTNRFDLVTVCGFTLAVLAVAFSSILVGDDLPFGWLLAGVSAISVGLFIKLRL